MGVWLARRNIMRGARSLGLKDAFWKSSAQLWKWQLAVQQGLWDPVPGHPAPDPLSLTSQSPASGNSMEGSECWRLFLERRYICSAYRGVEIDSPYLLSFSCRFFQSLETLWLELSAGPRLEGCLLWGDPCAELIIWELLEVRLHVTPSHGFTSASQGCAALSCAFASLCQGSHFL